MGHGSMGTEDAFARGTHRAVVIPPTSTFCYRLSYQSAVTKVMVFLTSLVGKYDMI